MFKGISHIGIAVKNLDASLELFKKIFELDKVHFEEVPEQKVRVASFVVGNVTIELTTPVSDDSPISRFLEKRGEGIHHIAFEVEGIENHLEICRNNGVSLINEHPVDGAHDMRIAFLHPKSTNGVLIELCEHK
ncbi:MAG: methylmalonyl-CoA epimerase [Ignavibacteria bacterium]|nr:methylmalonyl-CoA epimerase [Ignavibacteria bacterium]